MRVDDELELFVKYRLTNDFNQFHLTFHFKNEDGNAIFSTSGADDTLPLFHEKGEFLQICDIPSNFFNWGSYAIDLYVVEDLTNPFIIEPDIVSFTLVNRELPIGSWMGREPGDITPKFTYIENKF
jgi:lipopolysaccharide transport system ATP-binding protein